MKGVGLCQSLCSRRKHTMPQVRFEPKANRTSPTSSLAVLCVRSMFMRFANCEMRYFAVRSTS